LVVLTRSSLTEDIHAEGEPFMSSVRNRRSVAQW
jgi:hypothetical protein